MAFVVRTKNEPSDVFDAAFRNGASSDPSTKYIRDIDLRVWNGGYDAKKDGRFQDNAALTVNFAEVSNTFDTGFDVEGPVNGAPLYTKETTDKAKGTKTYAHTLDLQSMSNHSYNKIKASGIYSDSQVKNAENRLALKVDYKQTTDGVAAISNDTVRNVVAKVAVQNLIFNPQGAEGTPEGKKANTFSQDPTKQTKTLDAIAAAYKKTYDKVIGEIMAGKAGADMHQKDKNGKTIESTLDGTAVDGSYKFVKADLGKGATSYAIVNGTSDISDKKAVNTWLRAVGARISNTFSQDIHDTDFANDPYAKNIAYSLKTEPYAVSPQGHENIVLMQSRIKGQYQPYVANIYNAMKAVRADAPFSNQLDEKGQVIALTKEEADADQHKLEDIFNQSSKYDGTAFVKAVKNAYKVEVEGHPDYQHGSKESAIEANNKAIEAIEKAVAGAETSKGKGRQAGE